MKQGKATTARPNGITKNKLNIEGIVRRLLVFASLSGAATSILWTVYVSPRFYIFDYRGHAAEHAIRSRRIIWDADGHEATPSRAASFPIVDVSTSQQHPQSIPQQHHEQLQDIQESSALSSHAILPPTCQVQNIQGRTFDRIHFLHMRKAGGTALRMYFKKLEKENKIPVHVDEGPEFPEQPGDHNNTFYVTVIREPVARSISQYKFDQRWDCPTQLKRKAFKPTEDNVYNTFEEFVNNPSRLHPDIRGPLWICSSNCYARWATGVLYPLEGNVTDEVLLEKATSVLSRYNLILVQEWMKDPEYRATVSRLFQTEMGDREYFAECARQSRQANEKVPLVMANATLQQLQNNNQVDSMLFTDLTGCKYDQSSFQPLQYRAAARLAN